jgi:transketolase
VTKSLREVFGETLVSMGQEDSRLIVIDPDVGNSSRADIFADAFPERFFQVGIAEQNAVAMAAGMASLDFVPWLSTFSPFLSHRAVDVIRIMVAQSRTNVKLAGTYTGLLTGLTGRTHQDVQDIAIMRAMPDITLISPADPTELRAAMLWAQQYYGPVYFRIARDPEPNVFDESYSFDPEAVISVVDGVDLTIVSTGVQTARCLGTVEILKSEGFSAKLVHVPTIRPLDTERLVAELGSPPMIFSVEDHSIIGGLGGTVAEALASSDNHSPLVRIGLNDLWTESAPNDFLLDKYGLSAQAVAKRISHELSRLEL